MSRLKRGRPILVMRRNPFDRIEVVAAKTIDHRGRKLAMRRLLALLCLVLAGFAVPLWASPASSRPPSLAGCTRLLLSPAFTNDGTAFCVGIDPTDTTSTLKLYISHNRGHSWTATTPGGVPVQSTAPLQDALISPDFGTDRLIVVQADATDAYYSTDAGATFESLPLGPFLGVGRLALIPGLGDQLEAPGVPAHALIMSALPGTAAGQNRSYLFDPQLPSVRVVTGTSEFDEGYFASPSYTTDHIMLAAARSGGAASNDHVDFFACDLTMSCATKLGSLPGGFSWVDQVRFAADYPNSRTLVVSATTSSNRFRVFVSHDGGLHFAAQAILDRALDELYGADTQPFVALTAGPVGSHLFYARVTGGVGRRNPPSERLFTSSDDGRTWRLTAFGRPALAPGARGTVPYGYTHAGLWGSVTPIGLLTYARSRLWMSADWWPTSASDPYVTVWCSTNGVSWKAPCS